MMMKSSLIIPAIHSCLLSNRRISCCTAVMEVLEFHLSFHHNKVVLALQSGLLLLVSHTSKLKFILFGLQAMCLLSLLDLNYFKVL